MGNLQASMTYRSYGAPPQISPEKQKLYDLLNQNYTEFDNENINFERDNN